MRREAEAVAAVLDAARGGRIRLVHSPAHDLENERNPREDRRLATSLWLQEATVPAALNTEVSDRAPVIEAMGFTPLDALHLAFAEEAAAKWFATTDDQLLKRAQANRTKLRVQVLRPDELPLPFEGEQK